MQNTQKKMIASIIVLAVVVGLGVYYVMQKSNGSSSSATTDQLLITKGAYKYEEVTQGGSEAYNQAWEYALKIMNNGGVGPITLTINGVQTMTNIHAKGVLTEGALDVVFDVYGEDNATSLYSKGDVLFTLTPAGTGLLIEWKKMQPNLEENIRDAFFTKA